MGGWWDIFTNSKWRHIMVFWPLWDGSFIQHVEFARGKISIESYQSSVPDWINILDQTCTLTEVVEVELDEPEPFYYNLRGLMTCVSVVKAIIGLKAPLCLNPKQLIRLLLNQGGTRVWVEADQAQKKRNDSVALRLCRGGKQNFSERRKLKRSEAKAQDAEPLLPPKVAAAELD